ncbi:MAG: hypothetical protein HY717_08695 [Planctomycetes bacterium]|nr:hypothetical protein [Planctomycetota bacterium]
MFLGPLRSWMSLHVFTGLIAGALILFHSAFLPKSALGILAFASLLIVIATGLIGRYIYSWVPRTVEGREMEIEEIRQRLSRHREGLQQLGVDTALLEIGPPSPSGALSVKGFFATLAIILRGDREIRKHYLKLKRAVEAPARTPQATHRILDLLKQFCRERSWLLRYHELRGLMGSWRFFHRWLAIVMLLVAAFHIGVAMRYGELWIFQWIN